MESKIFFVSVSFGEKSGLMYFHLDLLSKGEHISSDF